MHIALHAQIKTNDGIVVISKIKMTEIERILNDGLALQSITDGNLLRHYDDKYSHQIIISIQVVNDPWCKEQRPRINAPCSKSVFRNVLII